MQSPNLPHAVQALPMKPVSMPPQTSVKPPALEKWKRVLMYAPVWMPAGHRVAVQVPAVVWHLSPQHRRQALRLLFSEAYAPLRRHYNRGRGLLVGIV